MTALTKTFWLKPLLLMVALLLLLLAIPPLAGVKAVYLWTDRLLFVLIVGVVFLTAYIRRKEHLRQPWLQVFRQRRAMVALIVLCSFVVVGLLDSVHYRKPLSATETQEIHYSVKVFSLLDYLLTNIRKQEEKSYSAPFAAHLFAKQTVTLPDGQQLRTYPRLKFGGAHLTEPAAQRSSDIMVKIVEGVGLGVSISLLLSSSLILGLAYRRRTRLTLLWRSVWRNETDIPWRAILLTVSVIITLMTAA
ncbi:MAG: hypothetical protein ACWGOW_08870, partial [Gammaproteobacteria bacterium]